jgi:hypothetical protein
MTETKAKKKPGRPENEEKMIQYNRSVTPEQAEIMDDLLYKLRKEKKYGTIEPPK